jgi:hypothetical protein
VSILSSDDSTSAHYTVTATQTGSSDSGWRFTGSVTIANPNATPLTGVTVSDAVDNGGTCSVANGSGITIAAGGSVTLDYTCTWTQPPTSSTGSDTATAAWDAVANNTPTGTTSVQTPFAFTAPTARVDGTVTLTDTLAGSLGTLTATDAGTAAQASYSYDHGWAVPASGCQNHPSTASLAPSGQQASTGVDVCRELAASPSPDTGAAIGGPLVAGGGLILAGAATALIPLALRRRTRRR